MNILSISRFICKHLFLELYLLDLLIQLVTKFLTYYFKGLLNNLIILRSQNYNTCLISVLLFVHCIRVKYFRFVIDSFWPRAMLKGPKRSFVVVVLVLLGVETWAKNAPNGTKKIRELKMFANENHCLMCSLSRFASLCGISLLNMVLYGLFVALYGL